MFFRCVLDRLTRPLPPIIKKFIKAGARIHSDYWKAYDCLTENGYNPEKAHKSICMMAIFLSIYSEESTVSSRLTTTATCDSYDEQKRIKIFLFISFLLQT
ncbi:hypothetical protein HZS_1669 [Henneguya salminicola]|nr:hypothetical protein HZS_1669 [Henneguya salminicola]